MYLFTKIFGKIKTAYTPVFLTNVAADKPPSKVEDQPNQTAIPKEFYIYYYMVLGKTIAENWVSKQSFFGFDIDYSLNHIFFRNKTFLLFKKES